MFNVYTTHKGSLCKLPSVATVREVKRMAETSASLGQEVLYRVFAQVPGGERYVTSYSVLGCLVREHQDVTIPKAHW